MQSHSEASQFHSTYPQTSSVHVCAHYLALKTLVRCKSTLITLIQQPLIARVQDITKLAYVNVV